MKTLTYFLITDCFPWRPAGFDALLSSPEAINDCCTLELRFGYSECPIIWPRNLFFPSISQSALYSPRETWSPVQLIYCTRRKKLKANFATLHLFSSVWSHSQQVCFISLRKHWCSLPGPSGCLKVTWIKDKKWDEYLQYLWMRESKLERRRQRWRWSDTGCVKEAEGREGCITSVKD